ncbi:hypothetical protein M436DRAFT_40936 [Aureobasidium namibiae CBS 147.97]|uniref:Uncharacterized protein n=1 Tax=Aureobasidium namibiae CBS 147.97 TaxID=1043004 RepID=A0A074WV33_9PEZI|nr:uncharacterized protein M436DRAFT_40936 [Aureobasidium namibiae CBS 147.97]KEQ75414.1 hypothetical protein M436DRAFT_40936 [Aureobasidium namibiae CBS 147.97]
MKSIPKVRTTTAVGDKKHQGRSSNISRRLETTWYIEAFCLTCSAVCAVLIVALLAAHNHHRTDSWHYYISINTVASALGTVFKSTLLMAVSAALAQGKWTWFRKRSGTLSTFESINAGSHDTVESFRLLWRMKGQHLVSAGALVVALGFIVEPFLQAVISDYGRLVDIDPSNTGGPSATISSSRRFDGGTQCISTYKTRYPKIDTTPDFAISASLYDGLNAAGSHGYQNVSFTCIFGNCTWPEYVSIAVRSTCFDISNHLKRTDPENTGQTKTTTPGKPSRATMWTDWTLEHLDLTLTNTNEQWRNANTFAVLQAAVVADANLTINFKDSQTLLAAFTIIRADDGHTPGSVDWDAAAASATECGLELVLNVYNSSVVNNTLFEQVVASVSKKLPESWLPSSSVNQTMYHPYGLKADPGTNDSNPIHHDTFLLRDDYALDPAGLKRGDVGSFNITQKTLLSTVDFLTSLIKQDNDNATVKAVQDNQTTLYTYGSPILQPLFDQTNTTATFDAVAKSMSNAIRNLGTEPVSGTAKQWVRFYQVRWAFLTLPLSLITSKS